MCKLASFWHNPANGDILVYDPAHHGKTQQELNINEKVWREGHYLPNGDIQCRVAPEDRITQAECDERLRNRFPTFADFWEWVLKQPLTNTLDVAGQGLAKLPPLWKGIGKLNCSSNQLKELKVPEGIKTLYCSSNQLKELKVPEGITELYYHNNDPDMRITREEK